MVLDAKGRLLLGALAAIAVSACSYLPQRAAKTTEMTGECAGEMSKVDPEPPSDQIVVIDLPETVSRGDIAVFSWPDPAPGSESLDDFIVQCWTRDGWRSAWIETGSFGVNGSPEVLVRPWDDNPAIVLSTERYSNSKGVLIVPTLAVNGLYRFQLVRIDGNDISEWTAGEARFRVDS